jgi:heme exporter protein A
MNLTIEDLRCVRAGRTVFDGLSVDVSAGEALILAGPNGAGKSTLLRILAGLLRADKGDARFGAVSLGADRAEFQAHVLYTGHLDAVKTALTVTETLVFWAEVYGAQLSNVPAALEALGLERLADHHVRTLSAGQRRRLGLSRLALIDRPLWLLDEPTVSLDAESSGRVAALARARCESGGIVVAATHIDLAIPAAKTLDPAQFVPVAREGEASADDLVLSGDAW